MTEQSNYPDVQTLTCLTIDQAYARLDEELPIDAYSQVPGGADLTDIDPNYMRKVLNEVFGICGLGWGYRYDAKDMILSHWTNDRGNPQVTATLTHLEFWFKLVEGSVVHICPIHVSGGSDNRNAQYAMKGAITNAIGNATSNLGFQESVYLGMRSHRTVGKKIAQPSKAALQKPEALKPKPVPAAQKAAQSELSDLGEEVAKAAGEFLVPVNTKHRGAKLSTLTDQALAYYAGLNDTQVRNNDWKTLRQMAQHHQMERQALRTG